MRLLKLEKFLEFNLFIKSIIHQIITVHLKTFFSYSFVKNFVFIVDISEPNSAQMPV